ncbi:DUF3089 domain-containing protein [Novosphingobium soli]|uniref:DUF3089 domain-containing protein n=1 Tax=Novosphingobium soli TaxID=574956 RepID=A0ABV6CWB3_9SPHN
MPARGRTRRIGAGPRGLAALLAPILPPILPLALLFVLPLAPAGAQPAPGGETEAAPDYTRADAWAVRETAPSPREADVFYIHPTTFASQAWNQPMADAQTRAWTRASVADRQLSAFAACCRRFMPFYRQASTRAFVARDGRGAQAYDLAYQDVRRAFRAWLAAQRAEDRGRPFILAGHSQGALLGLRLLKEEIAGTPLAGRLVAAYLPGIGIPAGALPTDVPPCLTPAQTRCLVSWNGFTAAADTAEWTRRSVADYGVPGHDPAIVCTNPITFDAARPFAAAAEGKGMLPVAQKAAAQKDAAPAAMVAHPAAARCQDGVLQVEPAPGVAAPPLPNGSLHMHDIALFWGDISANAALRVRSWRREHR